MDAVGEAEPDRALFLELLGKRAVVDQRTVDGRNPACRAQRIRAHQHAAAGSRRHRMIRPVHPGERIEHLEKENEGRNVHALRQRLTAPACGQRRKDQVM